jgi:hypothetical protein
MIDYLNLNMFMEGRYRDHVMVDMSDDVTILMHSTVVRELEPEPPIPFLGDIIPLEGHTKYFYQQPGE